MYNGAPFILTGHIDAGLPSIDPPPFSRTIGQNQTESFIDMTKNFSFGILIIPLVSILGNVAIAKAFCTRYIFNILPLTLIKKFNLKNIKRCKNYCDVYMRDRRIITRKFS